MDVARKHRGLTLVEMLVVMTIMTLLFAAGAITGEALVGILLAIPIVIAGSADVMAFWGDHTDINYPGIILMGLVIFMMFRVATGPTREASG